MTLNTRTAFTAEHRPGSPDAIRAGCTCPPKTNHDGRGWHGSSACFIVHNGCQLHCPPRETLSPLPVKRGRKKEWWQK